jgi:hypothetical protein
MLRDQYGSIDYLEEGSGPAIVFVPGSWATASANRGAARPFPDGNYESPGLWRHAGMPDAN